MASINFHKFVKDFAVLTHSRGLFTSSKSATDTPESVFCFLLRRIFLCDIFMLLPAAESLLKTRFD